MASTRIINCLECHQDKVLMGNNLCQTCYFRGWKRRNRSKVNQYNSDNRKKLRVNNPEKYRKISCDRYRTWDWARRVLKGGQGTYRREIRLDFLEDLQAKTENCSCCKCPLEYRVMQIKRGDPRPRNLATLDKIVPELGYIESNIAIICFRCNRLKDEMTLEEIKMIASYIERTTTNVTE